MKKRGFKFVGATICYAFMQAVGLVNDHTVDCWRYRAIKKLGEVSRKMTMIDSIGSQNVEKMVQFRIKPESDLLAAIEKGVKLENIQAGVIVSGLGALKKAVFRNLKWFPESYPVTPQDRLYLEIEKPLELVSLVGWIAPKHDGGVEIHAHFSASTVENDSVVTLGGHLTEGTICGIKAVVSILVTSDSGVYAGHDEATQSFDIFFKS